MPGKRGYYECCYDYDDLDASNGVNIKCEYEIKKANQKYYPLKISDVTVKQNDSSVGIMGRIENPYDEDFDVYEVEIILRNSKGKVIGLGLTNDVDGVKARSSTAFDTRVSIFGDQSENDVDSYELYAHPWYLQY